MWRRISIVAMLVAVPALAALVPALASSSPVLGPVPTAQAPAKADPIVSNAMASLERGRQTFRYNAFGSNLFFSKTLGLNEVLSQVTPRQALALGVKVDVDNLPRSVRRAIQRGAVDLDDPAVTRFLFERYAVVGVVANVEGDHLKDLGITCAFCHSTVDDSLAPGIGHRLDGWANRDLNVGAILSIAPNLQPLADLLEVDVETVKTVLQSWGPGEFDAHLNLDGKAFRPDGDPASVLIPPAFGLAGVNLTTYEGWGGVPYWNAYVGGHEMNGLARFYDPRLADAEKYPIAAKAGIADTHEMPDLLTEHLADLQLYQLAIPAPDAPAGSFDVAAAERGEALFAGKAGCAECHVPPIYTEPGWNLHLPEEIGIDSFQADRGPEGRYRTTPLAGLWSHTKGGFYHDGRFPTLMEVMNHYDSCFGLGLSTGQKSDLVEFVKSR